MDAFGELRSVGRDQQGEMRELRWLDTCCLKNQDVLERVGEVILAAHYVADAEINVIGAGGEVIGRGAVAAEEREIFDISGWSGLLTVDCVTERDCFTCPGHVGDAPLATR